MKTFIAMSAFLATGAVALADQPETSGVYSVQEPTSGVKCRHEHELCDATIVVRWSQLAQDNAFALDPAMTDPFPNARGWTMMYLAMHDALNAIVPRFNQYAYFGSDSIRRTRSPPRRRPPAT